MLVPQKYAGWVGWLCLPLVLAAAESPLPLVRVHAHNDYEHTRPLFDALDHGFCSVEADIYLVEGQLLVAHDRDKVDPHRTLQALYLEPLRQRIRANGGRVFPHGPPCYLLIDIKSGAIPTYTALDKVLRAYADVLTEFQLNQTRTNALTAIITGNRPRQLMVSQNLRYAAYDGRLADLDSPDSSAFMPWISDNWSLAFRWRGSGPFPAAERVKLQQIVAQAHQHGRLVRLWAAPDRPEGWEILYDAGVDLINTDDLAGLQTFLLGKQSRK